MVWPAPLIEAKQTVSNGFGLMHITSWDLGPMKLGHVDVHYDRKDKQITSHDDDTIRMHFGLKGDCDFYHKQLNTTFRKITGHHNILYSRGFEIHVENTSLHIETFGVTIEKKAFLEICADMSGPMTQFVKSIQAGEPCILANDWKFSTVPMRKIIHEIITCQLKGGLKKVFLSAKALELLTLQVQAYTPNPTTNQTLKTRNDHEAMIAVRDILMARLDNPPSMHELAREAGINEFKLKKGFREIYGDTVFGFQAKQRLEKAHKLLIQTEKSSSEIAAELGFSSPQHFSKAFKKQFGITPGNMRKNPADIQNPR